MTGATLKDAGASNAIAAATVAHHDHVNRVADLLDRIAASGRSFTADDVRDGLPPDTSTWLDMHGNVLAGLFRDRSRNGIIRPIGYAPPRRARRRTNPNRVWQAT